MADYKAEMNLSHNEKLVAVNLETGTFREQSPNNIPDDKLLFDNGSFTKHYDRAWDFLEKHLDNREIGVVHKLIRKAEFQTNSLQPLSDETSLRILSDELQIGVNQVQAVKDKLHKLGVFASTSIVVKNKVKSCWILNPFLAFNGRFPERTLVALFYQTDIAIYCRSKGKTKPKNKAI